MLSDREKTFFASFSDFSLESESTILEFCRLAKTKGWQQDSDVFRSFWRTCFGSECPGSAEAKADMSPSASVDSKSMKRSRGPQTESEVSDGTLTQVSAKAVVSPNQMPSTFTLEEQLRQLDLHTSTATSTAMSVSILTPATSVAGDGVVIRYFDTFSGFQSRNAASLREEFERLAEMQKWKPKTDVYREQFRRCCAEEFRYFCGENSSRLEAWQDLCIDVTGVSHAPPTKNQCRKLLDAHFVNIFDFIDCKRAGTEVSPVFTTRSSFRRYTAKQKHMFPKSAAKENPMLSILLEKVFGGHR